MAKQYFKVLLKSGLPPVANKDKWELKKWMPTRMVRMCQSGWHVYVSATEAYHNHSYGLRECNYVLYVAEIRGYYTSDGGKICASQARIIRPYNGRAAGVLFKNGRPVKEPKTVRISAKRIKEALILDFGDELDERKPIKFTFNRKDGSITLTGVKVM